MENQEEEMPKFQRKYGTRDEVFSLGTAELTRGGLRKADLALSRTGKIVSRKKQESARANYEKYGFAKRVAEVAPEKKKWKKRRKKKKVE